MPIAIENLGPTAKSLHDQTFARSCATPTRRSPTETDVALGSGPRRAAPSASAWMLPIHAEKAWRP
jgi:hypothetical protein